MFYGMWKKYFCDSRIVVFLNLTYEMKMYSNNIYLYKYKHTTLVWQVPQIAKVVKENRKIKNE